MRNRRQEMGGSRDFSLRALPRVLALLAAGIALAGCGDVSLKEALQGDSPGELRFSPSAALIPLSTDFTFSILGGFRPYDVAVSAALAPKDDHTWVFPGQDTISADAQDFTIQAVDLLGNKATAVVTVYKLPSLALNVREVTLIVGDTWTFVATGGSGPGTYSWAVDDVPVDPAPVPDDEYPFFARAAGSYTVTVADSIGMSQAATVHVVPDPGPSSPLAITPTEESVLTGGQLSFTALGGSGSYTFSALPGLGSFADANVNPATYTAPAVSVTTTDTVSLTDGTSTVTATVTVTAVALKLSPIGPTVSAIGDTIQFTATGGKSPYTFSTGKPEEGSIDPVTGLYTQLGIKNNLVTVQDADGVTVSTVVKFK